MKRNPSELILAGVVLSILMSACGGAVVTPTPQPLTIRVAYSTALDVDDVPSLLANESLKSQNYTVETTAFAKPELATEAVAQGQADIGFGASRTAWAAIQSGAPLVTVMEQVANNYAVLALPEIQACGDLQGRRVGVNSEGSLTHAMLAAYIQQNCPGTKPEYVVISDSGARAAALLAGELDSTPLTLANVLDIELRAPGRFQTLFSFAEQLPDLVIKVMYVNKDFAAQHPEVVKAYIRALLQTQRDIRDNPQRIKDKIATLADIDISSGSAVADAYLQTKAWDVNGGLSDEAVQYSLEFFISSGSLESGLTVAQVADLSYLNTVLDEIGRK